MASTLRAGCEEGRSSVKPDDTFLHAGVGSKRAAVRDGLAGPRHNLPVNAAAQPAARGSRGRPPADVGACLWPGTAVSGSEMQR